MLNGEVRYARRRGGQCATKRSPFTPATNPIQPPSRSPFRSIRPSPTPSTALTTAPLCSTSRRKAIGTAGSPTRPRRFLKNASLNLKAASARSRSRPDRPRCICDCQPGRHRWNIVSVPQLYGTTHTLLGHVLPRQGITTRFADSDKADAIERLIDENTKAVFAETIGNPAGNCVRYRGAGKGRASSWRSPGRRQHWSQPQSCSSRSITAPISRFTR